MASGGLELRILRLVGLTKAKIYPIYLSHSQVGLALWLMARLIIEFYYKLDSAYTTHVYVMWNCV